MSTEKVLAPQLITNAEMVYLVWVPEDEDAAAALVPQELQVADRATVFLNQYLVDSRLKLSSANHPAGFGDYSLTYAGVELAGQDLHDGTPARWWTHYLNSSENMRNYARERGVPTSEGETHIEVKGEHVYATTVVDGKDIIRTHLKIDPTGSVIANGQLRYITRMANNFVQGQYPFVAQLMNGFEVQSIEFPDPNSPLYDLRPKSPLDITFGFYSPDISFCYPGGEDVLDL